MLYSQSLPYQMQLLGLTMIYIGLNIIEKAKEECNVEREIIKELDKFYTDNHNKEDEENSKKKKTVDPININVQINNKNENGSINSPKFNGNKEVFDTSKTVTVSAISHYKPTHSKKILDKRTIAEILANFNSIRSNNNMNLNDDIVIHLNHGSMKKQRNAFVNYNDDVTKNLGREFNLNAETNVNRITKSGLNPETQNSEEVYEIVDMNKSGDLPEFYQSFDENMNYQKDANSIFQKNPIKEQYYTRENQLERYYSNNKDELQKNKENRVMTDSNKKPKRKSVSPNNVSLRSPNQMSEIKSQKENSDFRSGKDMYSVPLQYSITNFSEFQQTENE